jgi:hypothetical protein
MTIEASVNDQLRFASLVKGIEKMDRDQLLEIATELARLAYVIQPAGMRWAAKEAAQNLSNQWKDPKN